MDITVAMFAQICLLILSTSAASLTLLNWYLSKNSVRTKVASMKASCVSAQLDKSFHLDTSTFMPADEDPRRVTDINKVLRRVRRDVDERTAGQIVGLEAECGPIAPDDSGCTDATEKSSVAAVA